jgi:hypothetical protein
MFRALSDPHGESRSACRSAGEGPPQCASELLADVVRRVPQGGRVVAGRERSTQVREQHAAALRRYAEGVVPAMPSCPSAVCAVFWNGRRPSRTSRVGRPPALDSWDNGRMKFCFRIRLVLGDRRTLRCPGLRVVLDGEESAVMRPADVGSIADARRLVIRGSGYHSTEEAETAGTQWHSPWSHRWSSSAARRLPERSNFARPAIHHDATGRI